MQVLLPPSETKRAGGADRSGDAALAHASALGSVRARVKEALRDLSRDEAAASKALKLGAKSRADLAYNRQLETAAAMASVERYTGVLYDALGVAELDGSARKWIAAHVSVQSSLFGLIGADDPIPAYRLSASSRLKVDGENFQALWRDAHRLIDWHGLGWILDLRSKDYAALAPLPEGLGSRLLIAQRSEGGEVQALNHFNKAAKGDLVRRLANTRPELESAQEFISWAAANGLEVRSDSVTRELILITDFRVGSAGSRMQRTTQRSG
ncbi:YaaA family protein [Leucobacter sp. W1153]|uniref:YaaA family protein n=1 Tax=Leucobacter sp. W1153 TaxID=3439064 RepID=UPI003F3D3DB9